jgi:carbon starvation protein CstA
MSVWYILQPFGILLSFFGIFSDPLVYFPVLVCCTKENLATLLLRSFEAIGTKDRNWKMWPFVFMGVEKH